jgi:pyrimidine-specific ribonucleoside hydrolase
MVKETFKAGHTVVFNGFPLQKEVYADDVQQIMDEAITCYGTDEWKACVLTNELHGHLGIYSIIGAKMGIKAKEWAGTETGDYRHLEVISYAGSQPPYSCLNDGIQVSTGATFGQGKIHLATDNLICPMAVFNSGSISFSLRLKNEYIKVIDTALTEGMARFGLSNEKYGNLVRTLGIKCWLEWDRNQLFLESILPPTKLPTEDKKCTIE